MHYVFWTINQAFFVYFYCFVVAVQHLVCCKGERGCYNTLSDGHVVEAAQSHRGKRAAEQSQGIRRQSSGVGIIGSVCVAFQEVLGFGYCHLLFLYKMGQSPPKNKQLICGYFKLKCLVAKTFKRERFQNLNDRTHLSISCIPQSTTLNLFNK